MKGLKNLVFPVALMVGFVHLGVSQNEFPLNNTMQFTSEQEAFADTNFHFSVRPFDARDLPKDNHVDSCNTDSSLHLSLAPVLTVLPVVAQNSKPSFLNIYGLYISGNIQKKLTFNLNLYGGYFLLTDNTFELTDSLSVLPHFTNHYHLKNQSARFFDFTGCLSYSPNHIFTFSAGKGKQFWGSGYRSLFLSDNTNPYPYFKATVSTWKIKYVWLVSFLQGRTFYDTTSVDWQPKYTASHFLSWNLTKWFNLSLFETVIWRGRDSLGVRNLDVNYLNPIIFYRPVEFSLGSPDNVIMGGGWNVKILKKALVYNQFIFDEFKLAEIKAGNGWWANKFGLQLGVKTFWKNLILQTEYNWVRPFTYSHGSSLEAYSAWRQPLAHPLGANFDEWLFIARYQKGKHSLRLFLSESQHGLSSAFNTGGDIFRPYDDNRNEYGNTMLQGYITKVSILNLSYGYSLFGSPFYQAFAGFQLTGSEQKTIPFFFIGIKTNFMNYYSEDYFK